MTDNTRPIYLDYNATTPIDAEVGKFMLPFLFDDFGNPSSSHYFGQRAKQAVEEARARVASLVNCMPSEVFFTSGGTEANNWAIKGTARANIHLGNHIITTAIEHPAVTEVFEFLKGENFDVSTVNVDSTGMVDPNNLLSYVNPSSTLVSVMLANNEVGSLQPVSEIARLLKSSSPHTVLHSDASQSVGKIPIDFQALGTDLLTIAGHKLYAPKGVGALIVREGCRLEKFLHGAGHERGQRAGTESVLLIVGLGKACQIAKSKLSIAMAHTLSLTLRLEAKLTAGLLEAGIKFRINGPREATSRLPNTLSISMAGVALAPLLDKVLPLVACSSGSACHSGGLHSASSTLVAMGVPLEYALCTLRLSVGRETSEDDVDDAARIIVSSIKELN